MRSGAASLTSNTLPVGASGSWVKLAGSRSLAAVKPERPLLDLAMRRMGSTPATAANLGDRLDTDILGGQRPGLTTILVLIGAHDPRSDSGDGHLARSGRSGAG